MIGMIYRSVTVKSGLTVKCGMLNRPPRRLIGLFDHEGMIAHPQGLGSNRAFATLPLLDIRIGKIEDFKTPRAACYGTPEQTRFDAVR